MIKNDYFQTRKILTLTRLDNILDTLPYFLNDFFLGIEETTSPLTRLNYATDLQIFFDYVSIRYDTPAKDFKIDILDKLTATDI